MAKKDTKQDVSVSKLILFGGGDFMDLARILAYINSCSIDKVFPTTVLRGSA